MVLGFLILTMTVRLRLAFSLSMGTKCLGPGVLEGLQGGINEDQDLKNGITRCICMGADLVLRGLTLYTFARNISSWLTLPLIMTFDPVSYDCRGKRQEQIRNLLHCESTTSTNSILRQEADLQALMVWLRVFSQCCFDCHCVAFSLCFHLIRVHETNAPEPSSFRHQQQY